MKAASLYRDDRVLNFFEKYGETECLEMFDEYAVASDPSSHLNDIPHNNNDVLINTEEERTA